MANIKYINYLLKKKNPECLKYDHKMPLVTGTMDIFRCSSRLNTKLIYHSEILFYRYYNILTHSVGRLYSFK